jgi:hypothetical protein
LPLPTPPPAGRDAEVHERFLSFAGSGGYLAISTDTVLLEEHLREGANRAKMLRDFPGLNEAAQKVGGMDRGFFGFENHQEVMRSLLTILKKDSGALAMLISATPIGARLGWAEDSRGFKEWFDFALLPDYEKLSKYFYFSVYAINTTPEGVGLNAYSPVPPGLK